MTFRVVVRSASRASASARAAAKCSIWSANRPEDALHHSQQGAATAAELRGTVTPWLYGLQARAAALLGDEDTVRAATQRAVTLREQVTPDELDALGGIFTYPEVKQRYYTVEAAVLQRGQHRDHDASEPNCSLRLVETGDTLLAPRITRRLIERFARHDEPQTVAPHREL